MCLVSIAFCKNPVEGSWWSFDDTRVTRLDSPEDAKSASAYILFYQRRSSSATVTNGYHWCRSLLKKYHKFPPLPPSCANTLNSGEKISGQETSSSNSETNYHNNVNTPCMDGIAENDSTEIRSSGTPEASNHKHMNGYHNHNGCNGKSNGSVSSSGSSNGISSEGSSSSSSAPLARMEEIAIGLSLGVPKEVQIESTV